MISIPIAGLEVVGWTTKFPSIVILPSFKPNVSALAVFAVLATNLNWAPSIVPSAVAINSNPGAVPISTLPEVFEAGVIEIPIIFTDRTKGESKMSLSIVWEAIFGLLLLKIKKVFKF